MRTCLLVLFLALARTYAAPLPDEVVDAMREVHAGFKGQQGYVAQFGDSITYSMAFWTPMGWGEPQPYLTEDDGLPQKPSGKRWRDVIRGARDKGPKHGNYSGWKVGQVLEAMDPVIDQHQPEVAIIMIGTNDIAGGNLPDGYRDTLANVIDRCLAAHCIPLLNTIPPRRDRKEAVDAANAVIRALAKERRIPLVDFHAACLAQRPGDSWDGTIISKDGVHPSGGKTGDYSKDNLANSGYALRNWVNFLAYRQLYFRVLRRD